MEKCMKDSKGRASQIGACVLGILLVGLIGSTFLWHKSSDNVTLDEVKLKEVDESSGMFAIMLEKNPGKGDYEQIADTTWPTEGYTFNDTKSGCLDSDGQEIEDVNLRYEENKIKLETGNTSYCYIYFDKNKPKASEVLIQKQDTYLKNTGKGDLQYRYVGTQDQSSSINNYVCFGASSCPSKETDDHMYRIIGITSGGQLKIQKNSAISTAQWWTDYTTDKSWADSKIYTSLKGSDFYESTTYVSETMKSKIDTTHQWNIGDVTSYSDGTTVYNAENTGSKHPGAVGLAYASDYYFAYNDGGTQNCNSGSFCKSWMIPTDKKNLWKNTSYEWTMSRYVRISGGLYFAGRVNSDGYVSNNYLDSTYALRPVFYLQSTATISGGDGKVGSPYIIN